MSETAKDRGPKRGRELPIDCLIGGDLSRADKFQLTANSGNTEGGE